MKSLFVILLVCIELLASNAQNCIEYCPATRLILCAPDLKGCFFEFLNDCYLERENCAREQKRLPRLGVAVRTKCGGRDRPACKTLLDLDLIPNTRTVL